MARKKSIAEKSLQFTGLFEAELLTNLMLRFWNHPFAADKDFPINLLESAAEILRSSIAGNQMMEGLPPNQMSLISALWLAEFFTVTGDPTIDETERELRNNWLQTVRRTVPSCFCDQSMLDHET